MTFLIYGLIFGSGALMGHASYPLLFKELKHMVRRRTEQASRQLDEIFVKLSLKELQGFYLGAPVALGLLGWLSTGKWFVGLLGVGLGLLVPQMVLKHLKARRRSKFHHQLVEALLLLSSSLRAGLSLLQAFAVLAEELTPPSSEEFALVLKEMRMGVSLGDALLHLKQRMPSDDITLFVTAVLVVRETGGNVTTIFTRLVETLRERSKIRERIVTLTFMAKMQGVVMALLPILFTVVISRMDPNHLKFFMEDPDGKVLLASVVMVQLFGMVLFMRFSRSPI